jgi:GNAT superfamily N-acetyltransferase
VKRAKGTPPAKASARNRSGKLTIQPVTTESWSAFAALFEARGSPHYCWCTPYRLGDARALSSAEKKQAMQALVERGVPIGVVAMEGDQPVGWCSIAPRETYVKLARSRTMPRVSAGPTWTVLCFFIVRPRRGTGVALALLEGALRYARAGGAEEVEGYPHDTAGISATHRGHSRVFAAAGFQQRGKRWVRVTR